MNDHSLFWCSMITYLATLATICLISPTFRGEVMTYLSLDSNSKVKTKKRHIIYKTSDKTDD